MRPADQTVANVRETGSPSSEPAPVLFEGAPLSTAETAECKCPEFCERDHDRD